MRKLLAVTIGVGLFCGCEGDPNSTGYWVKKLGSKRINERVEACNRLRKAKDTADSAKIEPLLKDDDPRVKAAAAEALGELGDKGAVPQLVDAVDFSVSGGGDRESRAINEANKQIAQALGLLGDKQGTSTLIKMARSKDNIVKLEAVRALGLLRDPAALDTLMDLATDDNTEPFIAKKAIMALGRIGDPKAVPAIEKMLFKERQGKSFYPESSFAVFQIGAAAATPLLALLDGKDPAMTKWAQDNGILPEAILAKTAQVLGDIGDPRAIKGLIARLSYTGDPALQLLVRSAAAESLGRMRAKEAAEPIGKMLGEDEANIRDAFGRSLEMIGDPRSLGPLFAAASKGSWDAREGSLHALANLGGAKELALVQTWAAAEPARWQKECVGAGNEAKECTAAFAKHKETIDAHLARLKAGAECGGDSACWTKKLNDQSGPVRERAAWELGRAGKPEAIPALLAAVQDEDLQARYAKCIAIGWLLGTSGGKAQAKAVDDRVSAILTEDEGKTFYMLVDEELKRLQAKTEKALHG